MKILTTILTQSAIIAFIHCFTTSGIAMEGSPDSSSSSDEENLDKYADAFRYDIANPKKFVKQLNEEEKIRKDEEKKKKKGTHDKECDEKDPTHKGKKRCVVF